MNSIDIVAKTLRDVGVILHNPTFSTWQNEQQLMQSPKFALQGTIVILYLSKFVCTKFPGFSKNSYVCVICIYFFSFFFEK